MGTAAALLRKNLSKTNRWRYATRGTFSVRGGISNMLYSVGEGHVSVKAQDGAKTGMCVRVRDPSGFAVPLEDWMLAIALLAQHDEERLLRTGHSPTLARAGCSVCETMTKALEYRATLKRRK